MRRVRLTEGQLHNVIKESVSQILNELDWKTYDSAMTKRKQNMRDSGNESDFESHVRPLANARNRAVQNKYPHLDLQNFTNPNSNHKMFPDEQEESNAFDDELDNYYRGNYKYGKGGIGYYLNNEK